MVARIFCHLIGIFCTQRSILDSIECYCTQLHSITLFELNCTRLKYFALICTHLQFFELNCTQFQYFALKCTQINSTVIKYTLLHSPAIHCAQLHCALHSTNTCNCTQMYSDALYCAQLHLTALCTQQVYWHLRLHLIAQHQNEFAFCPIQFCRFWTEKHQYLFCSCKANTFLLLHACFQDKQPFQTDSFHTKERLACCPKMPRGNCIQAQRSTKNIWQSFSNALLSLFLLPCKSFQTFLSNSIKIYQDASKATYLHLF